MTTATASKTIAIVGGGITGATAAQTLSKYNNLTIHVFDQGRRGVGGRTSSRSAVADDNNDNESTSGSTMMRWDHGCQFFRADTPQFQEIMREWMAKDFVREWTGDFESSDTLSPDREFFGLPSSPPFYVGWDGMQSLTQTILNDVKTKLVSGSSSSSSTSLRVFTGTRVAQLERDDDSQRWLLSGTTGLAAFHDTSEIFVKCNEEVQSLGEPSGYDAIILTDASSSFGKWHRASAGIPEEFAKRVRERVGARVPLFTAMIAFDGESNIPFDAASFDDPTLWFAAKSNSKPGMEEEQKECWTLVSTPEYAMAKIEETPMQDPTTGEFIPQSKEYLTSVPAPDLFNAFRSSLLFKRDGMLGEEEDALDRLPKVVHIEAQRWGSAMPCHRHLDNTSTTRKVISGVPYDSGRFPLAPTKEERQDDQSFLVDESLMLFQAGDMMSSHTPGLEGAALSGFNAAEDLYRKLHTS
ncbi:hypothetical protein ACHAXR_004192 [Thalassiosira sp. AJA248-18]